MWKLLKKQRNAFANLKQRLDLHFYPKDERKGREKHIEKQEQWKKFLPTPSN
jgi:hypothetical protein